MAASQAFMSPWQREAPLEEEEEEVIKVTPIHDTNVDSKKKKKKTDFQRFQHLSARMHVTMLFFPFLFRSLRHGYGSCHAPASDYCQDTTTRLNPFVRTVIVR